MDFPGGAAVKDSTPPDNAGDAGDLGLIPGSGNPHGGGRGNPLQYSHLENSIDRRAWLATVHRVTKSQTQLTTQHRRTCYHLSMRSCKVNGVMMLLMLIRL